MNFKQKKLFVYKILDIILRFVYFRMHIGTGVVFFSLVRSILPARPDLYINLVCVSMCLTTLLIVAVDASQ